MKLRFGEEGMGLTHEGVAKDKRGGRGRHFGVEGASDFDQRNLWNAPRSACESKKPQIRCPTLMSVLERVANSRLIGS